MCATPGRAMVIEHILLCDKSARKQSQRSANVTRKLYFLVDQCVRSASTACCAVIKRRRCILSVPQVCSKDEKSYPSKYLGKQLYYNRGHLRQAGWFMTCSSLSDFNSVALILYCLISSYLGTPFLSLSFSICLNTSCKV